MTNDDDDYTDLWAAPASDHNQHHAHDHLQHFPVNATLLVDPSAAAAPPDVTKQCGGYYELNKLSATEESSMLVGQVDLQCQTAQLSLLMN
jgi:hypothetical protein